MRGKDEVIKEPNLKRRVRHDNGYVFLSRLGEEIVLTLPMAFLFGIDIADHEDLVA